MPLGRFSGLSERRVPRLGPRAGWETLRSPWKRRGALHRGIVGFVCGRLLECQVLYVNFDNAGHSWGHGWGSGDSFPC